MPRRAAPRGGANARSGFVPGGEPPVAGQSAHFSWTTVAGVTTLVDLRPDLNGDEGTDRLINVEFIRFDDRTVTLGAAPPPPPPPPPNQPPSAIVDLNGANDSVAENCANGTPVGIITFSSDPEGGAITYSLSNSAGGRFAIDSTTGRITVANSASLTAGSYQVTAVVSDGDLSASRSFTIDVAAAGTGGSQFRVNGTVAGRQQALGDHGGSAIAALSGGGYVVTWESEGQDTATDPGGIYGQRFDAAGNRLGGEFRVHSAAADVQTRASVTALANGKFVVSWETFDNGSNFDVHDRVFNANGTADLADQDAHGAGADRQPAGDRLHGGSCTRPRCSAMSACSPSVRRCSSWRTRS
jgi:hypothetical protein